MRILCWVPIALAVGAAAAMVLPTALETWARPGSTSHWAVRGALVLAGLAAWHGTQSWISQRASPRGEIGDAVHDLTRPIHAWLLAHPRGANAVLVVTSAVIDALGLFLLGIAIFGTSLRPFVGLLMIFALRQLCQWLCAVPVPKEMIWRYPGAPSLLVTYHVANDLFFSGHTALAVFAAIELVRWGGWAWLAPTLVMAVGLSLVVLVLRAHYTMDVVAGVFVAFAAAYWAADLAPLLDEWAVALVG